ncbi:hypothetical protein LRS74_17330 [Streptomyces sp. LX-29]|uniref:hypothetical protein n=1 Tax=Streptomyces sp. LX-29 TaxID=2900152 RepID=UPI00240D5D76|nr:hypothetical protein [Streptomyces sp. LX-29]WFB08614.1 hypothetical protein LRS74_17330 [Streptomyces sp. LX-29]
MTHYLVGGRLVAIHDETVELSLGTPPELWLGVKGESEEERAGRLAAARDIFAEEQDPNVIDLVIRLTVAAIEADAEDLLSMAAPAPRRGAEDGAAGKGDR